MKTLHDLKDALREAITDVSLPCADTRAPRADAIEEMKRLGNAFADLFGFILADFARSSGQHGASVTHAECSADHIRDTLEDCRHDACALDEDEEYRRRRLAQIYALQSVKVVTAMPAPLGGADNSGHAPC